MFDTILAINIKPFMRVFSVWFCFMLTSVAYAADADEPVNVFVELVTPSVAEWSIDLKKTTGNMPVKAAQKTQAEKVTNEQQEVLQFLSSLGAKHVSSMRVSANGLNCKVFAHQIADIEQHPKVKSVVIVKPVYPLQAVGSVGQLSGVPVLPTLGLTGKGKTVAIVGTGIRYDLETFGGTVNADDVIPNTNFQAFTFGDLLRGKELPMIAGNDFSIREPGSFPTSKFVEGADFIGGFDLINRADSGPDNDPFEPTFSHETLVAAIVAGNAVEDRIGPGVAPGAGLLAVKTNLDGGDGSGFAAPMGVEYALDPNQDGSFDDKVDVINLSLGADGGVNILSLTGFEAPIRNAEALGVVVVAGAGNSGNSPFILGAPAVMQSTIAVAAHHSPGVPDARERQAEPLSDFAVAGFSSRGGVLSADYFKPDVSAPGVGVTAGGGPISDGTSFATPFISGLAAVLLEQRPELTPEEVKALIQNSSAPSRMGNEPDSPPYPLSLQGVGRVQADKAVQLTSLVMPGGLSFGILKPSQKHFEERTLTLKNLSGERRHFRVSHEVGQANPGIELRLPRVVHLPPNSTKSIRVRMVADPRKLTPDDRGDQLIETDGWITFDDGVDSLRVGYMAEVEPASEVTVISEDEESITLSNSGFVASEVEAFARIPGKNAGYRFNVLPDGPVELEFLAYFDEPRLPRTQGNQIAHILDIINLDNESVGFLGGILARSFISFRSSPESVLDMDASSIIADARTRWIKYRFVLPSADMIDERFLSFDGVSFIVSFDGDVIPVSQRLIEVEPFFMAPKSKINLLKNQSEFVGDTFLLIHRNGFGSEIVHL